MSNEPEQSPSLLLTNVLADAAKRGEVERFSELYSRVSPALHVWADLRIPTWARRQVAPEDIVQEVWIRAMVRLRDFDQNRGPFRRWLFGFARRVLTESLRKGLRREGAKAAIELTNLDQLPAEVTTLANKAIRKGAGEGLAREVAKLDDEDRRLFLLRALEERAHEDIAHDLGITCDAAKKKWQRLRARLESNGSLRELLEVVS